MREHADQPLALVITAAGINCDLELAHAFELAGARVESAHLHDLLGEPQAIDRFDLIGLPGGFSYGDAVAAGRIAAAMMRRSLWDSLVRAVTRGVPMIAPCNGFQIAAQLGLLPGPTAGENWPAHPPRPTVALAANASARFVDRWCRITIPANTRCLWTAGLDPSPDAALLPIAHGEGQFIAASPKIIEALDQAGQIAIRYQADDNPNGSMSDVAGICDATGLILGLMPHPERFTSWSQHPWWTRLSSAEMADQEPLGLRMFRNAVEFARRKAGQAVETHVHVSAASAPAVAH
jgi:phosphoribosylformylglycinamidine synthase